MYVLLLIGAVLVALALGDQHPFTPPATFARPRFQPLRPPAVPLAVRSPYLSTWLSTHNQETLNGQWPIFWTGAEVGWAGLLQVDDTTYEWLGYPSSSLPDIKSVVTESVYYTATKTVYTLSAGKVGLNVTFLTPITLDDYKRQSLPATYLSLSFWSLDNKNHSVSLYTDIDGNWLSGDANSRIHWSIGLNSRRSVGERDVISHILEKEVQGKYSEWSDKAEWGQIYWSTAMVTFLKTKFNCRMKTLHTKSPMAMMLALTSLTIIGCLTPSIRIIDLSMNEIQSLHSRNALEISRNTTHLKSNHLLKLPDLSILFTIGYIQDPILQFAAPTGVEEYLPLWKSYFTTPLEMTYFHYQDYPYAVNVSTKFDQKIEDDAYRVSKNANYSAIVTLSTRQALGGIVFAESATGQIRDGKGSKPLVFLKEISSDGNMQTVDVIFPAYGNLRR